MTKAYNTLYSLIEEFLLFSVLGWVYESVWCSLIEQNKGFVNKGFLYGPWLPIYGTGILLIFAVLRKTKIKNGFLIFCVATLIATGTELIGSYIMEAVTGSFAWDYTDCFCNFQGRIAAHPDMMFGFLTLIAWFGVMPHLERYRHITDSKAAHLRISLDTIFLLLFIADFIGSLITRHV